MQDQAQQEKAYCCGNSAPREAKLIAKFDLVVAFIGLLIVIVIFSIILGNPRAFGDFGNTTTSENATILSTIAQMSVGGQITTMVFSILWHLMEIVLALILFFGAMKKHHKSLLIWFISTLGACCIKLTSTIVAIFSLNEKISLSISLITSFLYNWYCLWIVKVLMREATSVGEEENKGNGYTDTIEEELDTGSIGPEVRIPMEKF